MSSSKLVALLLVVVMVVTCWGCWDKEIGSPTRPLSVRGWGANQVGSTSIKGEFLLNKGESTDNGIIGVRLIDLYPAKYHLLDAPDLPKAKMQFFKAQEKTVICEGVFTRGGNRLDLTDVCNDFLVWKVIYIRDVNYNEGWVFFDLR